jgi:hypothetical protein
MSLSDVVIVWGYVMWWKRRPAQGAKRRIGKPAPRRPQWLAKAGTHTGVGLSPFASWPLRHRDARQQHCPIGDALPNRSRVKTVHT